MSNKTVSKAHRFPMKLFQDNVQLSRERLEFYYSIAILIIIPLLIALNTLFIAFNVRNNFDTELRRKANLANNLISANVVSELNQSDKLKQTVKNLKASNDELKDIVVAVPDSNNELKVAASTDASIQGKTVNDILFTLVKERKQAIAQVQTDSSKHRYWVVVSPIISGDKVAGLVSTKVSLNQADNLISNSLYKSLLLLGITLIVVVLLLLNHFRFVEYAMLFRKLKEVDQMKTDFLSVATHELRAPMTVIRGTIENIQDGLYGPVDDKIKHALQNMSDETQRLNNLVTDLLNVSRIEQGKIQYDIVPLDSRQIVSKVVSQFTERAIQKGLTLSYSPPEQAMNIKADQGKLIEIMTNLVDNAIKYTAHGTVTVSQKLDGKNIRISVRDSGIGMSAADREKLFNRFYRIQTENTKNIGGTGLGLWIIKQYIEAMGGSISVDSLEGVGSEFIVEFPQTTEQPAPTQTV